MRFISRREHLTADQIKKWDELSKKVESGDIANHLANVCGCGLLMGVVNVLVPSCRVLTNQKGMRRSIAPPSPLPLPLT